MHPTLSDTTKPLADLLEPYRGRHPQIDEELKRHSTLCAAAADRRERAHEALLAWQDALARRWACEVAAQRAYLAVLRQLGTFGGAHAPYGPLLASVHLGEASTPRALLAEVRRLAATLALLDPRPPFGCEAQAQLGAAGDQLEAAIAQTDSCEAERRSLLSEQRVVGALLERAHERARRLIDDLGPEAHQA